MDKNSVVLIVNPQDSSSRGTGFLISYQSNIYLVTCKHVISKIPPNKAAALPKIRKTKSPATGYSSLNISKPKFHPSDNKIRTYDIAVSKVLDVNLDFLAANEIIPYKLNDSHSVKDLIIGQKLVAKGYPVQYAIEAFSKNIDEPLPPKDMKGNFRSLPLNGKQIEQVGFSAPLIGAAFAEVKMKEKTDGMSGGMVYTQKNQLVGMVLGHGNFELTIPNRHVDKFSGFIFATVNNILEVINA